jgi:hypothetical protein
MFKHTFFKRTFQLLLIACLATGALTAADNPFVGDWKLNTSRSKQIIDVMKVTSLGANKYAFDFGGGPETIAVDGTDQPGHSGTTLSVIVEGANDWKVVRKKDGRTLITGKWNLSQDGNTLSDNYTEFDANGSPSTTDYLYKRTAAGPGFAGTWEASAPVQDSFVLKIRPYEGDGLSFIRSPEDTRNMKFDGRYYPTGGTVQGLMSSARRIDEHTLEITDKIGGKVMKTVRVELSPDLKTLTRTVRSAGQRQPSTFVFERQ